MFLSLWFSPLPFPPFPRRPWVLPVRQGQRSISSVGVKFHATTKTLTRVKWYRGHCYKQAWCITMTDLSTMWLSFVILEIPRFLCGSSRGASALIKQQNECSVSQLRRSLGFWLASSFVDTGQLDTHTHGANRNSEKWSPYSLFVTSTSSSQLYNTYSQIMWCLS